MNASIKSTNSYSDHARRNRFGFHRLDGPAYINANGTKQWWLNGKCHREDGPAIEQADGDVFWYLYGVRYSFENYVKVARWTDEQIVMYKLEYM